MMNGVTYYSPLPLVQQVYSFTPSIPWSSPAQPQYTQASLPAYMAQQQLAPTQFPVFSAQASTITAQATTLPQAFHTMTPHDQRWNMDMRASSHLADNTDNNVSVEFDAFGFSIKDYETRQLLLRCDSNRDLYPVTNQPSSTPFALLSFSHSTWHRRLGHPDDDVLHGSLSRYKARLVANGCSQQDGIDYDKTFSPRSLYGLKQTSRAWFQCFAGYATRVGFQQSKTDSSLFIYHRGSDIAYLLLYVDDIILTASSSAFLQRVIALLHGEFAMTDLGSLNYFLGISAQRSSTGLFLSQSTYAQEILERAHMQKCNPCRTPVDTESKLGADGDLLHVSSTSQLTAYTDADWAGCPVTRRSTSGYCVFLGDNLLSWSAKLQVTLSCSSAEAEYRGVANVVTETAWRTRHIEIDIHFVHDFVASGQVRVLHVPSRFQYADIFTKGLPSVLFLEFRSSLNV
ncbi:ribonuclease H-like domain-containing protein [Tanacetum coccineum]